MKKNTFYGKVIGQMTATELQLLSIDLQITSLMKRGGNRAMLPLAQAFNTRTQIVNKCINDGGEYSRKQFLDENGLEDTIPMSEIKELCKSMSEFEKGVKGLIKGMIEGRDKLSGDDEHNNGKEEGGFQMN